MIQHRTFQLEARSAAGGRQIEASLSSEQPVYRPGLGNEILEHTADAIDLSRAPLPLLTSHDAGEMPVGVVENIRLVGRKLRGVLRFSDGARAAELWDDVKAGVLRNLSIGYQIFDGHTDGENYLATRWQPYEISLVSVPADHTVGIGRSFDTKGNTMNATTETIDIPENLTRSQRRAASHEADEIREILALGEVHAERGMDKLAMQYIKNGGKSLSRFRSMLLDALQEQDNNLETDVMHLDQHGRMIDPTNPAARFDGKYSLMRAVTAAVTGDWREAGFEREMAQELSRASGIKPRGLLVPFGALGGQRVMTTDSLNNGSALVPNMHTGFIEMLRNHSRVLDAGATVMPNLVGNIEIPKQTGGATAEWIAEDAALSGSDLAFASVTLTPKSVGGMLKWSRAMLHSAVPGIEQIARNDLAQMVALAIDRAALHGSGSDSQPTGIYAASNVNSVAMGGVPTHGKLVDMAGELGKDNALQGSVSFLTTPGMASKMSQTLVASSAGSEMIWSGSLLDGSMAGFRAAATNQVSSTLGAGSEHGIVLGNWADLIIGQWGGVDLIVDPYSDADRGRVRITVFCFLDVALRHPESFCKATGATVS